MRLIRRLRVRIAWVLVLLANRADARSVDTYAEALMEDGPERAPCERKITSGRDAAGRVQ